MLFLTFLKLFIITTTPLSLRPCLLYTSTDKDRKQQIHNTNIHQQTEKIAHKFKKAGYRIAYKTTNKTEHTPVSYTHLKRDETSVAIFD